MSSYMKDCVYKLNIFIDIVKQEFKNLKMLMNKQQDRVSEFYRYYPISQCKFLEALKENGCKFTERACFRQTNIFGAGDNVDECVDVYFIYGARGNDIHEAYDYCEDADDRVIIIFMDYFRNLVKQIPDKILGYSQYMDELVAIAGLFIIQYRNDSLLEYYPNTAAVATWKFMPFITAVLMAKSFVELTKADMSGVNPEEILGWIENSDDRVKVLAGCRI